MGNSVTTTIAPTCYLIGLSVAHAWTLTSGGECPNCEFEVFDQDNYYLKFKCYLTVTNRT